MTSDVDAREATLLVDYALDNGWTITSITSWDWFEYKGTSDDVVQLASPLLKFHDTQEGESWQQELRLTSAGGETVDWLGGVFWYQNEFERGDGGDRPIFLEDTYSAHPVAQLLLQATVRRADSGALRDAGPERSARCPARTPITSASSARRPGTSRTASR